MTQQSRIPDDTIRGKALHEIYGMKSAVVAGAAADTNIAVTGITTDDELVSVVEFAAGVPTDRTAQTSITSAGNIQVTVDTSGDQLQVLFIPSL